MLPQEPAPDAFEARSPHLAHWVMDGRIEIERDECTRAFVRALDIGGLVGEGNARSAILNEALHALDAGVATWARGT
jgi:hypothetical protein